MVLPSAAQSIRVQVWQPNGHPAAGVRVSVNDTGTRSTDAAGKVQWNLLTPGRSYQLSLRKKNMEADTSILLGKTDIALQLFLHHATKELHTVTVSDRKNNNGFTHLRNVEGMAIYAGRKSEVIVIDSLVANLATNNARQVYAKVAGLNIYENDGGGLQLSIGGRGLDPNRTANFNVRQNGYDIAADALGYPESYYTPPVEALKRIQVVRGAASLQYGTQFGGLLNFELKQPRDTKGWDLVSRQTLGSFGYFSSFNSFNISSGKISAYGFFQYKRSNGWKPNSGYEAKTAYADVEYHYKAQSHIGFELTHMDYLAQQPGGLTDQMFAADARQSNRTRNWFGVDWNLMNLEWQHSFSAQTKVNVKAFGLLAGRQSLGFRPSRPSIPDEGKEREMIDGDFRNYGAEARLLHHYRLGKQQHTLLVGLRGYRGYNHSIQGNGNATGTGPQFGFPVDTLINSDYGFPNSNYSLFAENIFSLGAKWTLTPGLRAEYIKTIADGYYRSLERDLAGNIINNKKVPEYRENPRNFILLGLGISYKAAPAHELYANVSQNFRSVTFNDIRITNPTLQVDPAIQDEKGFSADIGGRGHIGEVFQYDATVFSLLYGQRIGEVWKPNSLIKFRTNIGKAWISGLESYMELKLLRAMGIRSRDWGANIYTNIALIRSRYIESPYANVKGKEVEFIPSLNAKTGVQGAYRNWKLSLQIAYLASQYTDAQNSDAADPTATVGLLPAYTVFDLSLSWHYKWLIAEASCNNLGNRMYATRRASGYPGPGLLPADGRSFFLTLGVKLGSK
jgi:Fe(3+) dicitrate transport protein